MRPLRFFTDSFLAALVFFTRIPVKRRLPDTVLDISIAIRFLPLIGILTGIVSGGSFYLAQELIGNAMVAILLSTAAGILLTGAFHEDGLADSADGFGGGHSREKILAIMKDSAIGTYGMLTLLFVLLLKMSLLYQLYRTISVHSHSWLLFGLILCTAHALSRLACNYQHAFLQYARTDNSAKMRPASTLRSTASLILPTLLAFTPLIAIGAILDFRLIAVLIPIALAAFGTGRYYKRKLGGYTGDCLGATQQVTELVIYLFIAILWNFTL